MSDQGLYVLNHAQGELSQAFIEGEISLPAGRPEMAKVIMIRAKADAGTVEILDKKAMTDGTVTLFICYLCEEGQVHAFESVTSFKHTADLENARPGMLGRVQVWVSSLDYSMTDSRRLNINAIINVMLQTEEDMEIEAVSSKSLPAGVMARPLNIQAKACTARMSRAVQVEGELEFPQGLPPVESILYIEGFATVKDQFCEDGMAAAEGDIRFGIIYSTGDAEAPLAQFFGNVPFAESVSVPGAEEDCDIFAQVHLKDIQATAEENIVDLRAVLTLDIMLQQDTEIQTVSDAYSTAGDVALETREFKLRKRAGTVSGSFAVREKATCGEEMPLKVLAAFATVSSARAQAEENKLIIEAVLNYNVIYMDNRSMAHGFSEEIPLRVEETVPQAQSGMEVEIMLFPEQVQAMVAGNAFDIRALINWQAELFSSMDIKLVSGLELREQEQKTRTGIVVYFADDGDTLWNVAKRYRVSCEEISKYNPGVAEELKAGDKLILMCKR